jgi:phage terminase small subunit
VLSIWRMMTPAAARVKATRLLTNANMQRRIDELFAERRDRLRIDKDAWLAGVASISRSNMHRLGRWTADGFVLFDSDKLDPADAAAIEALEVRRHTAKNGETTERVRLKLYSKTAALDMAARHLGLYRDLDRPFVFIGLRWKGPGTGWRRGDKEDE